ncbi:MAG: hypothetical protein KAG20_07365 [Cocleimonas sp.]|nr:hypothetical protein [Cocleimonas sp.]
MQIICEGNLQFEFPDNLLVTKYDDWSFYRNQFNNAFGGTKAVDIIVVEKQITWLIEVKDYSLHPRTKPSDLSNEIALKIRDTLAGLVAAKINANDEIERSFAHQALNKKNIHLVLHLEQPKKTSRLRPKAIKPIQIQKKLKQLLRCIDAHPLVVDKNTLHDAMNWRVKTKPAQ